MNTPQLLALALCGLAVACSSAVESPPAAKSAPASAPASSTVAAATAPAAAPAPAPRAQGFYALKAADLGGAPRDLAQYAGKVTLVVNTASACGYTPQYAGLEALHDELAPRGFVVLGWPSNDFGGQEPGTAEEIRAFCTDEYHVTFPLFAKVVTKAGPEQSPIYAHLGEATGKLPTWNFCKYLIGKDGRIAFQGEEGPSGFRPDELERAIQVELASQ